jgi:hypothetical protein
VKVVDRIESLSQYVAHVETHCGGETVLFRGQSGDWPLLPKIARLATPSGVLEAEQRMFAEFKRQALPHLEQLPDSDWDWLSLAQHSGMATRFLDWSTNPLAALWFAVQNPAVSGKPGVVWYLDALDRDFLDTSASAGPFSLKATKVLRPRHISRRIFSQSGFFTVHKYL